MRGSALSVTIIIVAIILIIGMIGYIAFSSLSKSQPATDTKTSQSSGVPQAQVKDFAPNLSMSQKTTILIELSDSSMVKYIVPTTQVDTYVKNLPPGYHVVSKSP
ncbi:MAG TPA: hypothetical protein VLF93_07400 [Candidatus Saccharimonadales bacterium]|nr:hypothetical protein [Candidatus Saccharimonadales bacterium]